MIIDMRLRPPLPSWVQQLQFTRDDQLTRKTKRFAALPAPSEQPGTEFAARAKATWAQGAQFDLARPGTV